VPEPRRGKRVRTGPFLGRATMLELEALEADVGGEVRVIGSK
jgi:hypothetical protein